MRNISLYRRFTNGLALGLITLGALLVTVPLFLILGTVVYRGVGGLNWAFLTQTPKPVGEAGGGMANAIIGSVLILALASIPIAVTANVARIVGTGLCVQYWDPQKALGFFHEFSGWVMFVVSLACLYLVHRAMRLISPVKAKTT